MSERKTVMISGSRSITNVDRVAFAINQAKLNYKEFIHGGEKGVDEAVEWIAKQSNILTRIFKPDWAKHGKAAGPIRNEEMVKECDAVIAIWDGESRGTLSAINLAKKYKKELWVMNTKLNSFKQEA